VSGAFDELSMRATNLLIKFGLELAALASFAYWGTTLHGAAASTTVAIAGPVAAAGLWGVLAAPGSGRRLSTPARIPFELSVIALATAALAAAGAPALAVVFGAIAAVNAILLTLFHQGADNQPLSPSLRRSRTAGAARDSAIDGQSTCHVPT
jgi:hypothetical protein